VGEARGEGEGDDDGRRTTLFLSYFFFRMPRRRQRRVPPALAAALAAVAGAFPLGAAAMYADQVGVDDRVSRNLGPVRTALASSRAFVVGTDAGVVAAVNQRTGEIGWRTVLPEGA
jgi:hypothetical protein